MDGSGICQSSLLSGFSTLKQDIAIHQEGERERDCQIAAKYDTLPTTCQ